LGFHWEESYEYGGNIVKMSKASKDGECFYGLGDKATQMNLKGKDWKILPLINMLSERSRTFIQSSSLFIGLQINKPTVFSSTIHLELSLILS
jgi:3-dehydroquinate synthase class II